MNANISLDDIPSYIDHTLLKPDATPAEITNLCREARQYAFHAVCVNSGFVPLCASALSGCAVKVCAVVGFPLGAMASEVKAAEAAWAVAHGAAEIDMVMAIGLLKAGELDLVRRDIEQVFAACGAAKLKVILETGLLNPEEKKTACYICREVGVAFVKTSTGFGHGGATPEDVALMRLVVGDKIGVKASGGVKSYGDAVNMIAAGASRLGTSSGVAIVNGDAGASSY